jgi:hypothetical protein
MLPVERSDGLFLANFGIVETERRFYLPLRNLSHDSKLLAMLFIDCTY